ncbi:transmembrane protein 241 isoform X1 [Thamnophis elegans]|uniref:transmembrane protein 241 isoform X1 n=1 Tax=Thamnophis elegans TaxID=35005 RepID=UPI00137839B1|nr:transmembrane protein 241 isoform X1 [Thamnophis elegans]
MPFKRPATGFAFCFFYLSSYFTNKYVLSVLKFTYPTLFQGWQTLVGGILLHASWKIGWVEISTSSRSEVLSWLPASALFVGIIYSGSRALSRLPIPIFLTLHNAADIIFYGMEVSVHKEQNSTLKLCRGLILLVAAGGLPFNDPQFDIDGYFWALIHLLCVGAYKVFHKLWKPNSLSISEQQYINYAFSVVMLAFASHPTGDLFSALEFPLLNFYIFHSSCLASGLLGFLLTLHTMKLKSSISSGQYLAWNFVAKVITAGLSPFFFEITVNVPTACCLLLAGFAEVFLLYIERTGT